MSAHTPCLCDDVGGDGYAFCVACTKRRADARLIAAAPELYGALEALVAGVDDCDIERIRPTSRIDMLVARLGRARAAIAKARGE